MFDKFKEECGLIGIYGHPEAAELTYLGLYALQHRGQESAGIVSYNKNKLFVDKDKMEVYAIALYDQNGSTYTYKIVSFTPDAPVTEADFIFNEADFPDFDVIDMR